MRAENGVKEKKSHSSGLAALILNIINLNGGVCHKRQPGAAVGGGNVQYNKNLKGFHTVLLMWGEANKLAGQHQTMSALAQLAGDGTVYYVARTKEPKWKKQAAAL